MTDTEVPEPPALHAARLVDRWFLECFQGSRIAQSTETWSCVHAAKDDLKRRLAALFDQPGMV